MERHGPVPRKEGTKSPTRTNIHTRVYKKNNNLRANSKHLDFRSQTYQQCCFPIYREILFQLHVKFDWFHFFPLNVAFCFHTLVKHGHRAPDYRLQNHIHTVLSKRRTNTAAARGQKGDSPVFSRTVSLLRRADKILLLLFFFSSFFFGKSNFVKPQNQMRMPSRMSFFFSRRDARATLHHMTFWDRPAKLSLPLTSKNKKKQTNKKPPKPGKRHPWLPSAWCCTWILTMTCLLKGVCLCRSYQPACGVCECITSQEKGDGGGGEGGCPHS